ncbi:hypothetical protein KSP35_06460 [Aquihabitans sp. G128]|uniref:hypothetical protein n=1 Tax=Aquihabitans sp. G128 TaxID=2849779 RepID=UPI001C23B66D|nr:hypothetical protein [Aquihabitans sp. G128]QXC62440.1 hypothetical protein KSP35_06460 [Aquihabitans sp. G128]
MGFLDKVKAQAEQTLKQGQDKIDEVQAKKKADGLLRDLGAWYYAGQTGRDEGKAPGELARITAELQAHEAEHGELGGKDEPEPPAPPPPAPAEAPAPPSGPPPSSPPPPPTQPPAPPGPPGPPSPGEPGPPPAPPVPPSPGEPGPVPPLEVPPMPTAPPVVPPTITDAGGPPAPSA